VRACVRACARVVVKSGRVWEENKYKNNNEKISSADKNKNNNNNLVRTLRALPTYLWRGKQRRANAGQ
jgi:hypothetical protein